MGGRGFHRSVPAPLNDRTPRIRAWFRSPGSLTLAVVLVASGCLDAGGPNSADTPTDRPGPVTPSVQDSDGPTAGNDSSAGKKVDPKRHYHHYWEVAPGELLDSVTLFDDDVHFRPSATEPDLDAALAARAYGCSSLGIAEFNLETDGDQVPADSSIPWKLEPEGAHVDTVFAGTERVEIKVTRRDDTLVGDLYLRYKPANLNQFEPPNSGCGMPLDVPVNVTVGPGMADYAHDFHTSRWRFVVFIAKRVEGTGDQDVMAPGVPHGTFHVQMRGYRGPEKNLDPAHPDLYGDGLEYDLGCRAVPDVARQVVVFGEPVALAPRPPQEPLIDVAWPYGRIVPLLTQSVTLRLSYNYTGPAEGTSLELWFYGADSIVYERAPAPTADGQTRVYEIPTQDDGGADLRADPPYVTNSLWRFMLVPRPPPPVPSALPGPGLVQSVAEFEGDFAICGIAHRDPNANFE